MNNTDSCGCTGATKSTVLIYKDFLSRSDAEKYFDERLKAECSASDTRGFGGSGGGSSGDESHPDDGLFDQ